MVRSPGRSRSGTACPMSRRVDRPRPVTGNRVPSPVETNLITRQPATALHAVVYYPRLDSPGVDEFRRKHDPYSELIAEHLTLVFPVPVRLATIRSHVETVASKVHPFEVRIAGLKRTWDHWLYLALEAGHRAIVALHDQLYSGPLEEHRRDDLVFEPHIGLGFFGRGAFRPLDPKPVELDADAYEIARTEAEELGIDTVRRVETLSVVRLDPGLDSLEDVATVTLGP